MENRELGLIFRKPKSYVQIPIFNNIKHITLYIYTHFLVAQIYLVLPRGSVKKLKKQTCREAFTAVAANNYVKGQCIYY